MKKVAGKVLPLKTHSGHTAAGAAQKAVMKTKVPVVESDGVELSPRARELLDARRKVRQMPDVDEDKVAKIKAQLMQGTYRVDSRRIAARMLEEALLIDHF